MEAMEGTHAGRSLQVGLYHTVWLFIKEEADMEKEGKERIYLYAVGALVFLLVAVFAWKVVAVKTVEKKMGTQHTALVARSEQVIQDRTRTFLRQTTIPLVWAVRKEMLRENFDQINEYVVQFIKEPNFSQIYVVKADGTIAVSSDKKVEGTRFSDLYPGDLLGLDSISVTDDADGNIRIAAPVMGLNRKIGLLFMIYEPEKVRIESATGTP